MPKDSKSRSKNKSGGAQDALAKKKASVKPMGRGSQPKGSSKASMTVRHATPMKNDNTREDWDMEF